MNEKNIRQENGITIIALVITIIVMLILVAVSINISLNGGLFKYAKDAADGTKKAMENEGGSGWIDIIDEYTTSTDKPNTGDKILGSTLGNGEDVRDLTPYIGKTWYEWATDTNNTQPFYVEYRTQKLEFRDIIKFIAENEGENAEIAFFVDKQVLR